MRNARPIARMMLSRKKLQKTSVAREKASKTCQARDHLNFSSKKHVCRASRKRVGGAGVSPVKSVQSCSNVDAHVAKLCSHGVTPIPPTPSLGGPGGVFLGVNSKVIFGCMFEASPHAMEGFGHAS